MSVPRSQEPRTRLLRDRGEERAAHVTNMELFFDLVYVFAFTQLSAHLYGDLSWQGGTETAVIFVALWWSWSYTSWATGWIDPERLPVVALLSVLMIASLVMASAIPDAFTSRGETFAVAYVAMQLLRSAFMVWAVGLRDTMGRNYAQLLAWSAISGVVWIVGGAVHDQGARLAIWSAAAVVDLGAPLHGFRLPGAGATPMSAWTIAGGHLAERCRLLLMIAFGESFLRIGESFAHAHGTAEGDSAFFVGFLLVLALWSTYFLHHAEPGARAIERAGEEAGRLARSAYLYAHAAMVGAVIVVAVAIHKVIEAPAADVRSGFAAICVGGPALYLFGLALSKRWLGHGHFQRAVLGAVALTVVGTATAFSTRLIELVAVTVASVAVAIWTQLEA
jgi:low temperature requirement protein LtrA